MKNHFASLLFFMLLSAFALPAGAQTVNGKYGLTGKNGKVILPQVYDEVRPLFEGSTVYIYRKDDKKGLYNFADSTLYPCVFDAVYHNYNGYVIRQDDLYGFIVSTRSGEKYMGKIILPAFSSVSFSSDFISVQKNLRFGAFSNDADARQVVPFIATAPLNHDPFLGYYYFTASHKKVLLRSNPPDYEWKQVVLDEYAAEHFPFITEYDRSKHCMTVYDCKSGNVLSRIYPPSGIIPQFNDDGLFVETTEQIGEVTRITWYDPYTAKPFFTHDLQKKETLKCILQSRMISPNASYLVSVEQEKRRGLKYVDLGVMKSYTYKQFDKPRVRRIRPPLIGGGGGGFHYEWFWSGR